MKNKVFTIIVTYNSLKWIDKCLTSLQNSTISSEVVVIDNASKDDTVNYIKNKYPFVHIISNIDNKGFGQANNQGIEYAYKNGATHFFLLNQDAWVHTDTLEKLMLLQSENDFSIVSPIHLNGEGALLDYNYFNSIIIHDHNRKFVSDLILGKVMAYYKTSFINAAAWMISRHTIEEIGGFDPLFFHYGEDVNYCQRVQYHKKEIIYVPDAFVHHDREKQGNVKAFNKNVVYAQLLCNYCDINNVFYKLTKNKLKMHLHHLRMFVSFLFHFKFTSLFNLISSYFKFLFNLPSINRNMKQNKISQHSWLDFK